MEFTDIIDELSNVFVPFERDLSPLNQILLNTYISKIRPRVEELFLSYKDSIYKATTGRQSLIDLGLEGAKICLQSMSKKYRKKLLTEYFSEEGLLLHIGTKVDGLISAQLAPLIAEIKESKNGQI